MASLADTLSKSLSTPVLQPAAAGAAQLGTQGLAQSISQASQGKAAPASTGPARSSIGEQVQASQTQQLAEQAQSQADLTAVGLTQKAAQQEAEQQLSNEALDEQSIGLRQNMLQRQQEILADYTQGGRQLDLQKDKSRMEQLGFNMRLANDQYINQLQQAGEKSRLNDAAAFQEEMKRTIYADEEELLRDDLDFRRLINADERNFKDLLANLDMQTALDIAAAESKAANSRAMWDGISSAVSGGVQAVGMLSKPSTTVSTVASDATTGSVANTAANEASSGLNFGVGGVNT